MKEFSNARKTFREPSPESPSSPRGMLTPPSFVPPLLIEGEIIKSLNFMMREAVL